MIYYVAMNSGNIFRHTKYTILYTALSILSILLLSMLKNVSVVHRSCEAMYYSKIGEFK